MTNRIAFVLALMVLAVFVFDYLVADGRMTVFLGRSLLSIVEVVAFWR
jgi:Ca2+/H+ antiporter